MRRPKTTADHLARLDAVAARLALVEKTPAPNLTAISGLALEIGLRALDAYLSPRGADPAIVRLVRSARTADGNRAKVTVSAPAGVVLGSTKPARRKGAARG